MRFDFLWLGRQRNKRGKDSRQHGRLHQELLECNLGSVLDASAGGMRVLSSERPPRRVEITFEGYSLPGVLEAEVAWQRELPDHKWELGLKFIGVTPEINDALTAIGRDNRIRRIA